VADEPTEEQIPRHPLFPDDYAHKVGVMPYTLEQRVEVASMMAQGKTRVRISKETGISLSTLWRWVHDDAEFHDLRTKLTDAVIQANVQELRALSSEAIQALRRGLRSTTREQAIVKAGEVHIVTLNDNSLAVRAADLALKRIAEFAEQAHVDVSGSLLEHWMTELEDYANADAPSE
jgi:hypothetical protein